MLIQGWVKLLLRGLVVISKLLPTLQLRFTQWMIGGVTLAPKEGNDETWISRNLLCLKSAEITRKFQSLKSAGDCLLSGVNF